MNLRVPYNENFFFKAEELLAFQEGLCSMEIVSQKVMATEGLYSSQGARKVGRMVGEMYLRFSASLTNTKNQNWLFLLRMED
jgi:hypothetical protein